MSLLGPRPPLTYHPWPIEEYTEEQLGNIVYCLYKGYIPIFENVWTDYFCQPFTVDSFYLIEDYPRLESSIQPRLQDIFDINREKMWGGCFQKSLFQMIYVESIC